MLTITDCFRHRRRFSVSDSSNKATKGHFRSRLDLGMPDLSAGTETERCDATCVAARCGERVHASWRRQTLPVWWTARDSNYPSQNTLWHWARETTNDALKAKLARTDKLMLALTSDCCTTLTNKQKFFAGTATKNKSVCSTCPWSAHTYGANIYSSELDWAWTLTTRE